MEEMSWRGEFSAQNFSGNDPRGVEVARRGRRASGISDQGHVFVLHVASGDRFSWFNSKHFTLFREKKNPPTIRD